MLLLIDPLFAVDDDFASRVLGAVGLFTEQAIVIDPLNHFCTDPDKVGFPTTTAPDHEASCADGVSAGKADPCRAAPGRREHQRAGCEQPG